ncbi:hypothetical protein VQH23_10750 [Pararoseomonas sp. SCSIO 73927]|uniref:hypothetical protein n=1 Tax=Pararoseomonas sp. SCSIO 73927 TaxID=3114537 RepID=UPI0030D4DEAA
MSATHPASLTVQVPLRIRRRPGRKTVVTPERPTLAAPSPTISTCADPALVKALARAFRYQRMLDEGRYASIAELAEAENLDRGYMGRLLQLMLLLLEIVEATLNGSQSEQLSLGRAIDPLLPEWEQQAAILASDHRASAS